MGHRAGLDDVEKRKFLSLLRLELRHFGLPARSQSLYRLRYPGSVYYRSAEKNHDNTHDKSRSEKVHSA
jgi:hypothetical protein